MRLCITILSVIVCSISFATSYVSNGSGDWNTTTTWTPNGLPGSTDDVEIVSGDAITLSTTTEVNNLTITSGSLSIGSNIFSIYGDLAGAQSDNLSSTLNSILEINDNGSAASFTFPTSIVNLKKLTINRTAGATSTHTLDLDDAVPADSIVLVLTNGIIYMNGGSIFQMNSHAVQRDIPCSNASHIDGIVQRAIKKSDGSHIFPVGDNGICRPMGLEAQNGTTNIEQIQFIFDTPPNNLNVNTSNLPGGIFQNFYWDHKNLSTTNMQRRLFFERSDFPGFSDADLTSALYLANTDGIKDWDRPVNPRSIDLNNNFVEFANASAANDDYWTFGSIDAGIPIENIVLPIELISFDAEIIDSGDIILKWSTASEFNNDFFTIEKSEDGYEFNEIEVIQGAGNSTSKNKYSCYDRHPFNGISYYRLKQTDYDGNFSYSAIIEVLYNSNTEIHIYTFDGKLMCDIKTVDPDEAIICLFDSHGVLISKTTEFIFPNISNSIILNNAITDKVLFINIETNSMTKHLKFLVSDK